MGFFQSLKEDLSEAVDGILGDDTDDYEKQDSDMLKTASEAAEGAEDPAGTDILAAMAEEITAEEGIDTLADIDIDSLLGSVQEQNTPEADAGAAETDEADSAEESGVVDHTVLEDVIEKSGAVEAEAETDEKESEAEVTEEAESEEEAFEEAESEAEGIEEEEPEEEDYAEATPEEIAEFEASSDEDIPAEEADAEEADAEETASDSQAGVDKADETAEEESTVIEAAVTDNTEKEAAGEVQMTAGTDGQLTISQIMGIDDSEETALVKKAEAMAEATAKADKKENEVKAAERKKAAGKKAKAGNDTREEKSVKAAPAAKTLSDETAVFAKGTHITGDVESDGSMELYGSIEGDIDIAGKLKVSGVINGNASVGELYADGAEINGDVNCTGSLKVGQSTIIIGNVSATSAVIAGAIKGNIDVQGPVILDSVAIVMGDIRSQSLQISNGAAVEGMCSQVYSPITPSDFFGSFKKESSSGGSKSKKKKEV